MHIHSAHPGLQPIATYAVGNDRAVAAQRAAENRKRLRQSANSIEAETEAGTGATLLLGHWLDSREGQASADGEYHASSEDNDSGLV